MSLRYITTNGINIAYKEANPEKEKIIFFLHGNSGSHRTWNRQMDEAMLSNYHLVAFDLPGCGRSIIPGNMEWDYSILAMGKLIAASIAQLSKNKPYILVGFSLGTNILAESLSHGLSPTGISLLSPCVPGSDCGLDKIFVPGDYIFFHDTVGQEVARKFFSETIGGVSKEDTSIFLEDFFMAKPPFRSALIQSVGEGKLSDEIELIKKVSIPIQVIFGANDQLLQTGYIDIIPLLKWRNTVYKIPGAGHYLQCDQPEIFNQLLREYLDDIS